MNLKNITADKLVALYRNRDLTITEVIKNVYEQIERVDKDVHAFLSICPERALDEARRIDGQIAAGEPMEPLAGVPVAIKDNISVRDLPTTCASRVLEGFRSEERRVGKECRL